MIDLRKGNCLEIMKYIPNNSIDMILCDLPYGTTNCKWDVVIPFEPLWEQYNRIIKDNGVIVLFGSEPFSSKLRMSNIKMYKYDWIWEKNIPIGYQLANKRPLKKHELISIFSKKTTIYNPQNLKILNKINKRGSRSSYLTSTGVKKNMYVQKFTNYPTSILKFKIETGLHPTQKPIALLEYLIKTYTNENDLVLDNCMGSGSTGVACINTNRNFIGIELDEKYFEIAKKRIEVVLNNKDKEEI